MIKIKAVGGYSEVGKNMTAVDMGDDAFIFDSGLFLPAVVEMEDIQKRGGYTEKKLRPIGAIPNDLVLKDIQNKVRAMLISHAHLDHVGAVPYTAHRYNAEVVATPFTIEFLKAILRDQDIRLKNKLRKVTPNSSFVIQGKKEHKIEFINITHSTLQTALIVLHTPKGAIIYANDFKFDNSPILGKRPNYKRLNELAKEGVLALVIDAVYADYERKTPSEKIARGLLEDVLLTTSNQNAGIIVTTFSSHIARLKSIVDCGKQLGRKILFLGRSLHKYVSTANAVNLVPFMPDIKLFSYRNQLERALKTVSKSPKDYMIVCTGHQGEPGSILDRISRGILPYRLSSKDHVVFSSSTIPSPVTVANKKQLEKRLKSKGVRIFTDVHVSGHCGREDIRDMIDMLQPQHIIPAHGDIPKLSALAELATEMGYKLGKSVHILQNGQKINL